MDKDSNSGGNPIMEVTGFSKLTINSSAPDCINKFMAKIIAKI